MNIATGAGCEIVDPLILDLMQTLAKVKLKLFINRNFTLLFVYINTQKMTCSLDEYEHTFMRFEFVRLRTVDFYFEMSTNNIAHK